MTGITFKSHVEYNCKDLSKYGLDKPTADISVDYTTAETVTETSAESVQETADTEETESETETVEVAKQLILHIAVRMKTAITMQLRWFKRSPCCQR